tara:strand:- start:2164 stop:3429 length:1266 start_codon:yes stop_codon:yes gene_type:complete
MGIPALIAANPQLALTAGSILAKLGAGFTGRNDQRDARRKAEEENKRRIGRANLSRAFGGNPAVDLVNPKLKQSGATKLLSGLGTAAGLGAQAVGMFNQGKVLKNQLAAQDFAKQQRSGFESVLGGAGDSTSIVGDLGAAGANLSGGGGAPSNALQIEATPVVSSPLPSEPGFKTGAFKARQALQAQENSQLNAMLPFMKFTQEQGQLADLVNTIRSNPQALSQVGADDRARILPYLSADVIREATGRKLSEKGIESITSSKGVTKKVTLLQGMMEEAVQRNITGPIKGSFNEFLDSQSFLGSLTQDERTEFTNLADDELLVRINNTSESLIPTMRKATNETGVMTEKDEDRIRRQFPNTSGINDTRELAKLPRLIEEVNRMMGSHMKALEGQNFNVGVDSFGVTDNELLNEFLRRQNRGK